MPFKFIGVLIAPCHVGNKTVNGKRKLANTVLFFCMYMKMKLLLYTMK